MFTLRFYESGNGPYEVKGSAFSIYRAAILIGHDRPHIIYNVTDESGHIMGHEEFMAECNKDVARNGYTPPRVHVREDVFDDYQGPDRT